MKKEYIKPELEAVEMEFEQSILGASIVVADEDADENGFNWQ